ncbi:unnamed protein product [Rotaria sp. Silwood1]|nr:unnamed protein product [Rotaria sp. Silwood1]
MRSFSWLRLFFLSRHRNQLWRFIPLFNKRTTFLTQIQRRIPLSTLPLWLMVHLANIVEQLDTMFDKEEFQKAYEYIEKNKTNELFQSHYIQWRIARIFYKLSLITQDKKLKRKLVEEGFEQVKLALIHGNHIYSVHKWYGILLNEKSQYTSTDEQIRNAYEVLDHFEEAVRLNPQDPTSYYLLGSW